jgi:molecular chaperone DnaJ
MPGKDLYSILGVSRSASVDEIKKVYRKLARKYHPDVNPGNKQAEERFKEISAAFEVLSDPEKKGLYDEFGEDGLRPGFKPEEARAYKQWQERARSTGGFNGQQAAFEDIFGPSGFDFGDIFGSFGGHSSFSGGQNRRPQRGSDVRASMTVDLRDVVLGAEREITFDRPTACQSCNGTGTRGGTQPEPCQQCGGAGVQQTQRGPMISQTTCRACRGTGQRPGPACQTCGGAGETTKQVKLKVKVPPGIEDGHAMRLGGQGLPGPGGGKAGDLLIDISIRPHPITKRDGHDLYLTVPVTLKEVMLGGRIEVPTFQGKITLTIPPGSQNGHKLRVKGRGVGGKKKGDLYVVLDVRLPTSKRDQDGAKAAIDKLESMYEQNVRSSLVV